MTPPVWTSSMIPMCLKIEVKLFNHNFKAKSPHNSGVVQGVSL